MQDSENKNIGGANTSAPLEVPPPYIFPNVNTIQNSLIPVPQIIREMPKRNKRPIDNGSSSVKADKFLKTDEIPKAKQIRKKSKAPKKKTLNEPSVTTDLDTTIHNLEASSDSESEIEPGIISDKEDESSEPCPLAQSEVMTQSTESTIKAKPSPVRNSARMNLDKPSPSRNSARINIDKTRHAIDTPMSPNPRSESSHNDPYSTGQVSENSSKSASSRSNLEYNLESPHKVIIIEHCGTAEETKSFLNNDLAIATALNSSPINSLDIIDVRKNLSRRILIVKHKPGTVDAIQKALEVTKLGKFTVKCRLPVIETKSYGVIGPIGKDVKVEEILQALSNRHESIEKIERIKKGKDKIETMFLKVTFCQPELPEHLYIGYQRFVVKQYVQTNPWQCYKCQGFGHNAIHCRFKPRCLVCSKNHEYKDCPHKGTKMENPVCPNCGGKHAANFGGCPAFKKAKKVEHVRSTQKISYRDALKTVNQDSNKSSVNIDAQRPSLTQQSSPEERQQSIPTHETEPSPVPQPVNRKSENSSSQAERVTQCSCGKDSPFNSEEFLKDIAQLIHQILSTHVKSLTETVVSKLVNEKFANLTNGAQGNKIQIQANNSKEMKAKAKNAADGPGTSKVANNAGNNIFNVLQKTHKRKEITTSPFSPGDNCENRSGFTSPNKLIANNQQ